MTPILSILLSYTTMQLFIPSITTASSASRSGTRSTSSSTSITSSHFLQSFVKLVAALRHTKSTCTVVEQTGGGLISSSILMQPGASQCYIGGSVIYNTQQCQPLILLNNISNNIFLQVKKQIS